MASEQLALSVMDAQLLCNQDCTSIWQFDAKQTQPSLLPIIENLSIQNRSATIIEPLAQIDLIAKFYTAEGYV